MRTELREEQEMGEFVAWRRAQLTATGFSSSLAARTARDLDYDLHALIELAEAGCPPELAVRILAPLDGGSSA
jgi:CelD/BcsL family acetyltransferase involved in cellulose biosynthesis